MNLAGFLTVHNESIKGNIRRCLDSMSVYCDSIYVFDDVSTDDTPEVALSYSKVKLIYGDYNAFDQELFHKQKLLEFALKDNPDWLFWLDADEVLEKKGETDLRNFIESGVANAADGWTFPEVNLWRSERYYRLDNQYNDGLFIRLWRNTGTLTYRPDSGLHRPQYPMGLKTIKDCPLKVIHYGFASDRSIIEKYHTYKAHGQDGWALHRLIDESSLRLANTKPEWLGREPIGPTISEIKESIASMVCA